MSDVNVLLCAVDSAMNTLAAFDRDRADVTAADISDVLDDIDELTAGSTDGRGFFESVLKFLSARV